MCNENGMIKRRRFTKLSTDTNKNIIKGTYEKNHKYVKTVKTKIYKYKMGVLNGKRCKKSHMAPYKKMKIV